jgi:hypothetical protein
MRSMDPENRPVMELGRRIWSGLANEVYNYNTHTRRRFQPTMLSLLALFHPHS